MLNRLKGEACAPIPLERNQAPLHLKIPEATPLQTWAPSRSLDDKLRAAIAFTEALGKVHAIVTPGRNDEIWLGGMHGSTYPCLKFTKSNWSAPSSDRLPPPNAIRLCKRMLRRTVGSDELYAHEQDAFSKHIGTKFARSVPKHFWISESPSEVEANRDAIPALEKVGRELESFVVGLTFL